MTPREFCYWLQGFFEVVHPKTLTKDQVNLIKEKLVETFDSFGETRQIMTEDPAPPRVDDNRQTRRSAYDLRSSRGSILKMRTYC